MNLLLVFLGAGFGGVLRYAVSLCLPRVAGTALPWHTLAVNVLGGLLMGFLAAWLALRAETPEPWRLLLATGVLGGFTTFSAFSLETVLLWERGEIGLAAVYVAASVLLSIGALVLGLWLGRAV
jgi:CrcB protein